MPDRLRFTLLGCGSSPGVPRIFGDWGACDPDNPKNRRRRCSLLVQRIASNGKITTVVVDTGPDFRDQMIGANVGDVDGVIYTHSHADHVHGIDDLRGYALKRRQRIHVYGDETTMTRLQEGFGYCFASPEGSMYPPILDGHQIAPDIPLTIEGEGGGINCLPYDQVHGDGRSLGFLFPIAVGSESGGVAYSPDVSGIPQSTLALLRRDLDVWFLDALQYKPHVSHFSLQQALEHAKLVEPKRLILTHMHTPLDYATVMAQTPDQVEPGYDNLVLEFEI